VQKLSSAKADVLVIAVILLAGLKFTFGLEHALDIGLYDESNYLYSGLQLTTVGFPIGEGAPLYAVWYFLLSLFERSRIGLYYLNFKLMTILPAVLIYILLRRNRVSITASGIVSLFFLVSQANLPVWPKPSHFALSLALIVLIAVSSIRSLLWAALVAAIGGLLIAYVRLEYFLVYLLSSVLFIGSLIMGWRKLKPLTIVGLVAIVSISVLLLGTLGSPISTGKSVHVFGQHFSLNWVSWTGSNLNPWTDWEEIVNQNFGYVPSVWAALLHNPAAFLKHIAWNCLGLARRLPVLFFSHSNIIFPAGRFFKIAEALVLIGLCGGYIFWTRKSWKGNFKSNLSQYRVFLIIVAMYLIPGFVSAIIIYPRDHYLLLPGVLIAVTITSFVAKQTSGQEQSNYKRLLLYSVLVIALTPCFADQTNFKQENLETILFLKTLGIQERVNVLEAEGGYGIYVGDNYHRVAEYDKKTSFNQFLADRNIGMIVITDHLKNDTRFRNDKEWEFFLSNYASKGYREIDIPHTERKLIVRSDLLP
jgi:hypothetical protein